MIDIYVNILFCHAVHTLTCGVSFGEAVQMKHLEFECFYGSLLETHLMKVNTLLYLMTIDISFKWSSEFAFCAGILHRITLKFVNAMLAILQNIYDWSLLCTRKLNQLTHNHSCYTSIWFCFFSLIHVKFETSLLLIVGRELVDADGTSPKNRCFCHFRMGTP